MKWSIKNYNAWIKAARAKEPTLTIKQARGSYRAMSTQLKRPLYAVDVKRHPRVFKQSTKAKPPAAPKRKPSKPKEKRELRTISQWNAAYQRALLKNLYKQEIIAAGVDTGRRKGKGGTYRARPANLKPKEDANVSAE